MKRKKPAGWKYKKERQNYYKNKGYKDEPFDEGITETFTKTGVRKRTTDRYEPDYEIGLSAAQSRWLVEYSGRSAVKDNRRNNT